MHFTTKDKAAIWSLVKDFKFLEQEDYNTQLTAQRMKALHNFLEINEEVERISKNMEIDIYVHHIAGMSTEKKEYVTSILMWVMFADGKATEGENELFDRNMILCELSFPNGEKAKEIIKEIKAAGQDASQSVNRTSGSSNAHDWKYYQKKFTEDYEDGRRHFKWNSIIPLTAQEAIGAMAFCKVYLNADSWNNESYTTLARIIDLCEEEYANDSEVSKVLPKYKEALKLCEEKNKKRKEEGKKRDKLKLILWAIVLILVILQIIFWGWWTILSGFVTVCAALLISFVFI